MIVSASSPARWSDRNSACQGILRRLRFHAPPILLLLLAPAGLFGEGILRGTLHFARDTQVFYFPLTAWVDEELRRGSLPLWFPLIFGGYPLFADGEIGMAHPLVLLALWLLDPGTALVWLRYAHFALAGVLAYWFAAVLGIGRFGAVLAGLVFAYSSFLVAHMQHENILRSAVWLPALLALLELALRSSGGRRVSLLLLAGVVVGVQWLGVHVQPVLISLLTAAGYLAIGPLGRVTEEPARVDDGYSQMAGRWAEGARLRPDRLRPILCDTWGAARKRAIRTIVPLCLVAAVGAGLAAVQLLPLLMLGQRSMRGEGVNYYVSTSYALSFPDLITLLFPYFFRAGVEQHWSLWPPQETTVYLGIAPLLLAGIAVVFVRHRIVFWLAVAAVIAIWLAFADYAGVNPYYWIWSLPGFSVLRAPGRFILVFELAVGCLAGVGAQWLFSQVSRGRSRAPTPALRRALIACCAGVVVLAALMGALRVVLEAAPEEATAALRATYLALRREQAQLSPWTVYHGLASALDTANPRTQLAFLWLVLAPMVLLGWTLVRRGAALWRGALLALVAADLLSFATAFYAQTTPSGLRADGGAVDFLVAQGGLHRVFVEPSLNHLLGPNVLVSSGIAVAGGYSSLEPRRLVEYWWSMVRDDNVLLDLFNVRYVVAPRRVPGMLVFDETRFHPADRLLGGGALNPAGQEEFRADSVRTDQLTVVGALDGPIQAQPGETAAEVTLIAPGGEQRRLGLRAGMELDSYRESGASPSQPRIAYQGPAFVPNGRPFPSRLYGASLVIDPPMQVERVRLSFTGSTGVLLVHGLGLRDASTGATRSITSADRTKYQQVYLDEDLQILENLAMLPKAFLAPLARTSLDDEATVEDLLARPGDPRRAIVLDHRDLHSSESGADATRSQVEIVEYRSDRIAMSVQTDAPSYLIVSDRFDAGWRAWVDGQETPVLRANIILRGVSIPPGTHYVTMLYDPWWIRLGAAISATTASVVLLVWCALALAGHRLAWISGPARAYSPGVPGRAGPAASSRGARSAQWSDTGSD